MTNEAMASFLNRVGYGGYGVTVCGIAPPRVT
jgi:hypothetical protein